MCHKPCRRERARDVRGAIHSSAITSSRAHSYTILVRLDELEQPGEQGGDGGFDAQYPVAQLYRVQA